MAKYCATIQVPSHLLDEMNRILSLHEGLSDTKEGDTIHTFCANFEDGYQAYIKVCNGSSTTSYAGEGSPPWVDCVLFTEDGDEINCFVGEGETIEGEYHFFYGDDEYVVNVEGKA